MKNKLINFGMLTLIILLMANQVIAARCTANGKEISCDQFFNNYGWIFIIFMIVFIIFIGFWIWMLIDCMKKKNFKDKTLWILIILLTNLIGAIVYYFVIKRKN